MAQPQDITVKDFSRADAFWIRADNTTKPWIIGYWNGKVEQWDHGKKGWDRRRNWFQATVFETGPPGQVYACDPYLNWYQYANDSWSRHPVFDAIRVAVTPDYTVYRITGNNTVEKSDEVKKCCEERGCGKTDHFIID